MTANRTSAVILLLGSASAFAMAGGVAMAAPAHHGLRTVSVASAPLAPLPGAKIEAPPPPLTPEEEEAADAARYSYLVPDNLDWRVAPPGLFLRADFGPGSIPAKRIMPVAKPWKPKKRTVLADVNRGRLKLNVSGIKAGSDNLSEAAHLQLALQRMSMDAKFSAEAGHKSNTVTPGMIGPSDLWQRDLAEVAMRMTPMPMAEVAITGAEMLTQTYRQPAQIGESGSAAHMLQTEKRSAKLSTVLRPMHALTVTMGASGDALETKDTSASDREDKNSNLIETQNEEVFVSARWTPLPGVAIEGGTTTRNTNISWRATNSKSGDYRAAEPHVSLRMRLFDGTVIQGKVAYSSSGYDTSSFVSYASNATKTETVPVEPDHAWKLETRLERQIGPAQVALHYMKATDGTVTEFGYSGSGVQAPVSTTLVARHEYGFDVTLPLKSFGVPHTTVSGNAVMRDSRVLDPVTGYYRRATGEIPASLTLKLEHQLPADKLRFGLTDTLHSGQVAYQTKEISETPAVNKLGAYIAYRPGDYELNLKVDGLTGSAPASERYIYDQSRAIVQVPAVARVAGTGPTVRFSLVRHLN